MTTVPHSISDIQSLLTEKEAALLIGFSRRSLQKWRLTGNGPAFIRISARAIRYMQKDLIAWIDAHRTVSPSSLT